MIDTIVSKHLAKRIPHEIFFEEPESLLETYIIIENVGYSHENGIGEATIAIQSYDSSLHKAYLLNKQVEKAMSELLNCNDIIMCKLNTSTNFTDPETKRYRYQSVYDVMYYDFD